MTTSPFDVEFCRRQFPALSREINGRQVVYFDGPAGSQVPQRVIAAVADYLAHHNANRGGGFATSAETDRLMDEAQHTAADFLGCSDPGEIVFGANMTSLTFALSRALITTWKQGDEIVVTGLDHDANITTWRLAAEQAGAGVRMARVRLEDCTLDQEHLLGCIGPRTRLVALGCASNASGSINPLGEAIRAAHDVGALVYLDAVHFAPHRLVDVAGWDCDFLVCSPYKFFGPHTGILWGRRGLLESLPASKVEPAPDSVPKRWMRGTQNHECICGAAAAIDYLADVGRHHADGDLPRRAALEAAYSQIARHEQTLCGALLAGLARHSDITVHGITEPARLGQRVPTVSISHRRWTPRELAERLSARGIFTWHGHHYALQLSRELGLEPGGSLRIGLLHYNTLEEIQRLLAELDHLAEQS